MIIIEGLCEIRSALVSSISIRSQNNVVGVQQKMLSLSL